MRRRRQSGFSLIELTMVMVIVGMASIPILGQFTQVASSTLINEDIQTASQLAQELAEDTFAVRRNQGYAAVALGTTNEVMSGNFSGLSRNLTVTDATALGSCPTGATCKRVLITVSRGLSSRAEVVLMLLNY